MPSSAGAPKKMSSFLSRLLNPVYDAATNFATEQRGWFMVFFVLPFSLVYDAYSNMRSYCIRLMFSAPALHAKRVEAVQAQLLKFQLTGKGRRLCTARPGWQSITMGDRSYKSGNASYPIRVNMMDILQFDANKRTVKVEPLVSMGQLSHFLIPKGFTLPILPELDDLTVGGLYMGVGIESSSHKFGLFNDTVLEAEVLTAKGQLLVCSRTQNRDLFDALPWSYGTLGFLVSLTLRIVPCKQYIKMWYVPTFDRQASTKVFQMLSLKQQDFDFVESLHYTRDKMVSMPAKFVDSIKFSKRNRIGLWYKPWFFKHVESFFSSAKLSDEQTVSGLESSANVEQWLDENFKYEFIPLRDYYHRHSKSIFWELEEIIPFGNHFLCRYLLGWALPPKISFIKFTQTQKIKDLYEATKDFTFAEKRQLMKFLQICLDYHSNITSDVVWTNEVNLNVGRSLPRPQNLSPTLDGFDVSRSAVEFLRDEFSFSDRMIDLVMYSMACFSRSEGINVEALLKRLVTYLSALGSYSHRHIFLYPSYGVGEIVENLARYAAVNGATQMLRRKIIQAKVIESALELDLEENETSNNHPQEEMKILTKSLIHIKNIVPPIIRCVCISTSSVLGGNIQEVIDRNLIIVPPSKVFGNSSVIRILELGSSVNVAPPGYFVLHLTMLLDSLPVTENDAIAASEPLKKLISSFADGNHHWKSEYTTFFIINGDRKSDTLIVSEESKKYITQLAYPYEFNIENEHIFEVASDIYANINADKGSQVTS